MDHVSRKTSIEYSKNKIKKKHKKTKPSFLEMALNEEKKKHS